MRPLHARNETIVKAVSGSRCFSAKERKVDRICRKGHVQRVFGGQQNSAQGELGKLRDLGYDLLGHPPYSPELAPLDFNFHKLEKCCVLKALCIQ
ncbi:hypothetical protein TNCV_2351731 [Trichonephila clavipes]|nr:hypothetical protein TNCV_2351731 [Trichonephila clavipes]